MKSIFSEDNHNSIITKIFLAVIVPMDEFEKIFSNMFSLLHLSEELLKDLGKRICDWKDDKKEKIADILVKVGPFIKVFVVYTESYAENSDLFKKLQEKHPLFKEAVCEFESRPECKNMKLSAYFMKPFQRLPQYRLLLNNYLKYLNTDSADYEDAQKAVFKISFLSSNYTTFKRKIIF